MFTTFFLGFCLFSLIRFSDVFAFAEDKVALLLVFKSGCNDSMCLCRPNLEKKRIRHLKWLLEGFKIPFPIKLGTKLHEKYVTCRVTLVHTTQNSQNKWTKILSLEMTIFGLNMIVQSGLEKIPRAPSELLLPIMAELALLVSRYL